MEIYNINNMFPKVCPNCNETKANNLDELIDLFGMRSTPPPKIRAQSWCKVCRKNERKDNYHKQKKLC